MGANDAQPREPQPAQVANAELPTPSQQPPAGNGGGSPRPPKYQGWPDSRWMVVIRSIGTGIIPLFIGIAATMVSWVNIREQNLNAEHDHELKQKQNAIAQSNLDLSQQQAEFQKNVESAKLAVSVIQLLNCEDDIEGDIRRESAFAVLRKFPDESKNLSAILSKCPKMSPQDKEEIRQTRESASQQAVEANFRAKLANARQDRAYGFDGPAARLFFEARNLLPKVLVEQVDMAQLENAKDAYQQGNFSEAADRFQKAFSRIQ